MEFVGIDKFSLLDYDENVSVVLFAPTCNFRCPFCHNGESVLNSSTPIKFGDILSYLESRVGLVDAVVISGGEPTLMDDLIEKIELIRKLGFKIKLDTNGSNPDVLENILSRGLIDYVAMDVKNSPEQYSLTSGCAKINIEKIAKSLQILKDSGISYELRTTIVKEFHNDKSIEEMGEFIKGADKLFIQKFVDRDGVIQKGLHEISLEEANHFKSVLSKFVKNVELRGY